MTETSEWCKYIGKKLIKDVQMTIGTEYIYPIKRKDKNEKREK